MTKVFVAQDRVYRSMVHALTACHSVACSTYVLCSIYSFYLLQVLLGIYCML